MPIGVGERVGRGTAVALGIVAVGMTFACAELAAALGAWFGMLDSTSAPFGALGAAFIAITPEWLKDFGIRLFGQSDKAALAVVMIATFLVVGAVIGLVGRVHRTAAAWLAAALAAVVAVAILTRPDAASPDLVPMVVGAAVGIWFLMRVLRPENASEVQVRAAAPQAPSRRDVLRATGIGAIAALAAEGASWIVPPVVDVAANRAAVRLPALGASAAGPLYSSLPPLPADVNPDVSGLTTYLTPAASFYRVDTAFILPRVSTEEWRLKVHGLVDAPFEITWADLLAMPQVERTVTLACVSNEVGGDLAGNAVWQGVRIDDLLARAKPRQGADCVYSTSADNFTVTTPLAALTDGRDAMLAIGMNGAPLPIAHGFPVRMVVPGLYGYVSATKWVVDLEVTRFADVTAYWSERGWAPRAPIKIASRIDTPGYDVSVVQGTVPVAGVAWAPRRGISAVEVQVDDGPWETATIYGAASIDTWRQWVYRWNTSSIASGKHTLRCRAIDGAGVAQTSTIAPPAPDGSSGYHQVPVFVK